MDEILRYIDSKIKLLDPRTRDLEPSKGDFSFIEMAVRKIDNEARTVEAVVSTPEVDRYQEIVDPKAFRKWLKHFKANPVMLAAHDHSAWATGDPTVIGKWTNLQITDEGLVATGEFMADDDLAERYWKRYRDSFMRAFSVGFIAHSWEMREFEIAGGVTKRLRVFTEVELLEISAVAVPANRGALARAASFLSGQVAGELKEGPDLGKLVNDAVAQQFKSITARDGQLVRSLEQVFVDVLQRALDCDGLESYFKQDTSGGGDHNELKDELKKLFA